MIQYPIFFDPKNRRAAHVSRVAWTLAVMSTVAGVVFLSSLFLFRTFPETLRATPVQRYAMLNDVAKIQHLAAYGAEPRKEGSVAQEEIFAIPCIR